MKLIIDTDIGTDVDDALALTYAVAMDMDLALVTTVHGNTKLRAKIAKRLLEYLGSSVPVAAGAEKPLRQHHIFWTGDEGIGFVDEHSPLDIRTDGIEALIETVNANAGNVAIACIAPLTNIASAFQRDRTLPGKINRLYIMGNALLRPDEFILNYRAHNFKVDPEAVDIVFSAKTPKLLVTTDVSKCAGLNLKDINEFAGFDHPAARYIASEAPRWLSTIKHDTAYLYDPLTVAHHVRSDLTLCTQYDGTSVTTAATKDFRVEYLARVASWFTQQSARSR